MVAVGAFLTWTAWPTSTRALMPELYLMAGAGGVLCGASPGSAASAFVFVAVIAAGARVELSRALPVVLVGTIGLAVSVLLYNGSALGVLAYTLGFAAALLAGSNARQSIQRAEQAELLLAESQRSREEQLRAARLQESTRIAREIHDVLAHALAGLTVQLEATGVLIEQGADRDSVLARVKRAHELAREGLRETRQAVGALRGETVPVAVRIEALVAEYRASTEARVELVLDGDSQRLTGPIGEAVVRVAQEALTNVRKHAPGASLSVTLQAGRPTDGVLVLLVTDRHSTAAPVPAATNGLASAGGGYGLRGMRERAEILGGSLAAGPHGEGWRVELRLPLPAQLEGQTRPDGAAPQRDGER